MTVSAPRDSDRSAGRSIPDTVTHLAPPTAAAALDRSPGGWSQLEAIIRMVTEREKDFADALEAGSGSRRRRGVAGRPGAGDGGSEVRPQARTQLDEAGPGEDAGERPAGQGVGAARAPRRGAHHRAVELPGAPRPRAAGRRGRRGQLRGAQAVREHAGAARRARPAGPRVPRRRGRRGRRGCGRRDTATARPGLRPLLLHRQPGGRQGRDGRRREAPHPGDARARRQEPGDRRRRRQGWRWRPTDRLGQAAELRPDVRRARLRAGRPHVRDSHSSPSSPRRSTRSTGDPTVPIINARQAGRVAGLRRERRRQDRPRRQGRRRRAPRSN